MSLELKINDANLNLNKLKKLLKINAQENLKDLQQLNWDYGVWADLYATY